jgi:hypothetical protein
LRLEVPDASGSVSLSPKPGLGFPTGKLKTIVLRVDDAFKPGAPRKLRLRSNLEILLGPDRLGRGRAERARSQAAPPSQTADLRYRGYSYVSARDRSSPEMPQSYARLSGTTQRWRDLIGYYTRFWGREPTAPAY